MHPIGEGLRAWHQSTHPRALLRRAVGSIVEETIIGWIRPPTSSMVVCRRVRNGKGIMLLSLRERRSYALQAWCGRGGRKLNMHTWGNVGWSLELIEGIDLRGCRTLLRSLHWDRLVARAWSAALVTVTACLFVTLVAHTTVGNIAYGLRLITFHSSLAAC